MTLVVCLDVSKNVNLIYLRSLDCDGARMIENLSIIIDGHNLCILCGLIRNCLHFQVKLHQESPYSANHVQCLSFFFFLKKKTNI